MLIHRSKRRFSEFICEDSEPDSEEVSTKHFTTGEVGSKWYNMMLKTVELLTDDSDALLPFYFGGPRQARLSREIEFTALVEKLADLSSDIVDMCNDRLLSKQHSAALNDKLFKKRQFLEDVLLLDSLLFSEVSFEGTFLSCFSSLSIPRSSVRNCMTRLSMNFNTFKSLLENSCLLECEIVQRGWLVLNFDEMPDEVVAKMLDNKHREPTHVALKDMFRVQFLDVPVLYQEARQDVCVRFNFNSNALQQVVKEAKEQDSLSPEMRLHSWLLRLIDLMNNRKRMVVANDEQQFTIAIWGHSYDKTMSHNNRMALNNH